MNRSVLKCKSYYSSLKGLLTDGKLSQSRLYLSCLIKEYGVLEPKVGRLLLHYLCLKDVRSGLRFLYKLKDMSSEITFPVSILKHLVKDGKVLDAYELVMEAKFGLPVMNVVDYSVIVDGLCKGGYPFKALSLCTFAERKGISLNIVTYNSVINGLCREGCLIEAFRLFDSLERIDLIPSDYTYGILIENLCKRGYLSDAELLFKKMILKGYKSNMHIYNSFIGGYCKYGQIDEALKILNKLETECLHPDAFTVSALINGYCLKGDLWEALRIFGEYREKNISPDMLGYFHLIKGLYYKGRMEESRTILRDMLRSQSVLETINKVAVEAETESIVSFISSLCEEGSIREAIIVLNEVVSVYFPVQKWYGYYYESQGGSQKNPSMLQDSGSVDSLSESYSENTDSKFASDGGIKRRNSVKNSDELFDLYYSTIASLCSKGELPEANRTAKEMLTSFRRDRV